MPITRPSRIESRAKAGGANRSMSRITASVPAAKSTSIGAAPLVDCPMIQPPATFSSDRPMIRITVPVTIGGKNRMSIENTGAISIMKSPETITDP